MQVLEVKRVSCHSYLETPRKMETKCFSPKNLSIKAFGLPWISLFMVQFARLMVKLKIQARNLRLKMEFSFPFFSLNSSAKARRKWKEFWLNLVLVKVKKGCGQSQDSKDLATLGSLRCILIFLSSKG